MLKQLAFLFVFLGNTTGMCTDGTKLGNSSSRTIILGIQQYNYLILSELFRVCKKLDFSKDWLDLPKFLCNLFIINPSGLFAGIECLTYLDNG